MVVTTRVADKQVGPIGYGMMGLTARPNHASTDEAIVALKAALDNGANLWNAGEFYGGPEDNSLTLLRHYFDKYPEDADKVVLSVKGAFNMVTYKAELSPEGIRKSVENCLRLLGPRKQLDIFEPARLDLNVPVESVMQTLAELVLEGKFRAIGLSEAGSESIRRAVKVHPVAMVETELSLWEDSAIQQGILSTCGELGIPVAAYSPIGRGMLTGQIRSPEDIPEGDFRRTFPRFSADNFPKNLELVEKLTTFAANKGCTPAQLAIGWVRQLSKGKGMPTIIPIPGATTATRIKENQTPVELTADEMAQIEKILATFPAAGSRYPESATATLNV